ncbi:class I SAM-dependent methyltransferase [bacterium]|nr:class I SAM-dependent methyltransferase [bacterium]
MMINVEQNAEIELRDQQATQYDDQFIKTRSLFSYHSQIRTVISHLDPHSYDQVLDAGCGTGIYTLEIARKCCRVLSVDFSRQSISLLQQKTQEHRLNNVDLMVGDLADVRLPANHFSMAICVEVLQHIPGRAKKEAALRNIHCALRQGGKLLIVVYRYGGWIKPPRPQEECNHGGTGLYRYAFTEDDCRSLLKDSGFEIIYISGLHNLPHKLRRRMPISLSFIETGLTHLQFTRRIGDYLIIRADKV